MDAPPIVPPPPAGNRVEFEAVPAGIAVRVPPLGVWRGSHGLFTFSLIWNGIVDLITIGLMVGMLAGGDAEAGDDAPPWVMILFLIPFHLIGLGVLLAALNLGRREVKILFTAEGLRLQQRGIFGTRLQGFPLADLIGIRVGPSGISVNDVPLMQLQIEHAGGRFGCLTQLTSAELDWLSRTLEEWRQHLAAAGHA
jgi:hypothetical protein